MNRSPITESDFETESARQFVHPKERPQHNGNIVKTEIDTAFAFKCNIPSPNLFVVGDM